MKIRNEIYNVLAPFNCVFNENSWNKQGVIINDRNIEIGIEVKAMENIRYYETVDIKIDYLKKDKVKTEADKEHLQDFMKSDIEILNELKTKLMEKEILEWEVRYKEYEFQKKFNKAIELKKIEIEKEAKIKLENKLKGITYDDKGNIKIEGLLESGNN